MAGFVRSRFDLRFRHRPFSLYPGIMMWGGVILRDLARPRRLSLGAPRRYQGAMEPLVDCVIEDDRWQTIGLDPVAWRAVQATLAALDLPETGFTLAVMGCDDARIAALNASFRDKKTATNVLSWPHDDLSADDEGGAPDLPEPGDAEDPESLGDIALSYDTCAREAEAAGKPLTDHVTHLIVHGLLHCLGYDHLRAGDAALMEATEVRILATLGLSDPY